MAMRPAHHTLNGGSVFRMVLLGWFMHSCGMVIGGRGRDSKQVSPAMRRRPKTIARRSPNFDTLESRSLLSSAGGGIETLSPSGSGVAADPRMMNWPGNVGSPSGLGSPTCRTSMSAAGTAGSAAFRGDSPFPSASALGYQPVRLVPSMAGGVNSPSGSGSPASPVSEPGNGSSQALEQPSGSAVTVPLRVRLEIAGFEFGDLLQGGRFADVDTFGSEIAPIIGANLAGSPGGTGLFGQPASVVSLTPGQLGTLLLNINLIAFATPDSAGDASAHGGRVAAAGPSNSSSTRIGLVTTLPSTSQSARPGSSALLAESRTDVFPGPIGDDLMAAVLPFDRALFERAVDHFFQQLDELDVRDLVGVDLTYMALVSLGLATTIAVVDVARRRLRHWTTGGNGPRVQDPESGGVDLGFPDLPGSWSSRLP
jgi:hypothetical protein